MTPNIDATVASISASLSSSTEININALAVSLALQIVKATNNNVEATFKFLDVAQLINATINDNAPSA